VTCMALSPDGKSLYAGSKCGAVVQWSVVTGKRVIEHERVKEKKSQAQKQGQGLVYERHGKEGNVKGHSAEVLAMAISSDGKLLASAGRDRRVLVWDTATNTVLKALSGHRDAITALVFRRRSKQLFSGSLDRTIKIWNLENMSYVETLYGHQDHIISLDSLDKDRVLSCGSRDRSVRLWKVADESQLVFQGVKEMESIDCVAHLTESNFVSGAQDSTLALWDSLKKKPIVAIKNAHGDAWITSVAALRFGDLVASGSYDGVVKTWLCKPKDRRLQPVTIPPLDSTRFPTFWLVHSGILRCCPLMEDAVPSVAGNVNVSGTWLF